MKKWITSLLMLAAAVLMLYGQSPPPAGYYEYWFDDEFAARTAVNAASSGSTLAVQSVDVGALTAGVHLLRFRARDGDGNWTVAYSQMFYKHQTEGGTVISPISDYEYWFDDEFAARKKANANAPNATFSLQTVDANALTAGVHLLRFRARDGEGNWTVTYSQMFYKHLTEGGTVISPISDYEYWFDDEFAARKKANANTPNATFSLQTVDAGDLADGVHRLRFRARDEEGNWTVAYSQRFLKMRAIEAVENLITGYRYWIDDGEQTTVILDEPVNPFVLTRNIPLSDDLDHETPHTFMIQFKDAYDKWSMNASAFVISPPDLDAAGSLLVMLPAVYENTMLVLTRKGVEQTYRLAVKDQTQYTFNSIPYGMYRLSLIDRYGETLGEIDDIEIYDTDTSAVFSALPAVYTVSLNVSGEDGKPLPAVPVVRWYDAEGTFLSAENAISGLTAGTELFYQLLFNAALGNAYILPPAASYAVAAGDNAINVTLRVIPHAVITGKVQGENVGALSNATVTVQQMLNGQYPGTLNAQTAKDGTFSIEALDDSTSVTVACAGYISQTITRKNFAEGADLGVIRLKPITGAVVTLQLNYTASVPATETPATINWFADYRNVDYTLKNLTNGQNITDVAVQYPDIVLLDETADIGDEIEVTAVSRKGEFNSVNGRATLDNALRASVSLNIVQQGSLRASYANSGNRTNVGMIYNAAGELTELHAYRDSTFTANPMPDGTYRLVSMGKSDYVNSVMTISQLAVIGLKQDMDYTLHTVVVKSGVIADVQIPLIPLFDESKMLYTDAGTLYSALKSEITAGNYQTFRAKIDFKEQYRTRVSNVKLIADVPMNCAFTGNSVMLGSKVIDHYSLNGTLLTIPMDDWNLTVHFCMIPFESGDFAPGAFVEFDLDGETIRQPIGAARFRSDVMTISAPKMTAKPEITVRGTVVANLDGQAWVQVYDGDVMIGETVAMKNGDWNVKCTLHQARSTSTHYLHAKLITDRNIGGITNSVEVTHDKSWIEVSKVTMYNMAHPAGNLNLVEFATVFDFQEATTTPGYYNYWPSYPDFTFTIDFTRNDPALISDVNLYVFTTDNQITTLPAKYDKDKGLWVAAEKFGSYNLPHNVNVDYTAKTTPLIDAGELNDIYSMYDNFKNEYTDQITFINSIYAAIQEELEKEDWDEDKIESLNNDLRDYLGMDDPEPVEPDEDNINYLKGLTESELNDYIQTLVDEAHAVLAEIESFNWEDLLSSSFYGEYPFEDEGLSGMFQVTTCDGYFESTVRGQGFTAYETNGGYFVYEKVTEYESIFLDFRQNICYIVKINALTQFSIRKMDAADAVATLYSYIDKITEAILTVYKAYDKFESYVNGKMAEFNFTQAKLRELIEYQHQKLAELIKSGSTSAQNKRLVNAIKDLENQLVRVQTLSKCLTEAAAAVGKVLSLASNLYNGIKTIHDYIGLYQSVSNKCPEDKDKADRLRDRIFSCGSAFALVYLAKVITDVAAICTAIGGAASAAVTGGFSLTATLLALGKLALQAGLDYALGWANEKQIDSFQKEIEKLKNAKCKCNPEKEDCCDPAKENCCDPAKEDCPCDSAKEDCNPCKGPECKPCTGPNCHKGPCPSPNPIMDPSGYVYEAVADNRLQGATATIYFKTWIEDATGGLNETVVLWDAENYGQHNPMTTDEYGMYGWDVPVGLWQVKYEKAGYATTYSDWLPVPPPQLDVNIGMTQYTQPYVMSVTGYEEGVNITFDKYMQPATFSENIIITSNDDEVPGFVILLNEAENPENVIKEFASKIRFIPATPFSLEDQNVVLKVGKDVKSYAGVGMAADFVKQITIKPELKRLAVTSDLEVYLYGNDFIEVSGIPAIAAAGKTITAFSVSPMIATVTGSAVLDKEGKAYLQISGGMSGATVVYTAVDETDLIAETLVQVSFPKAQLTIDPYTLDFGNVKAETASAVQTVTAAGVYLSGSIRYFLYGEDADIFTINETSWDALYGGTLAVSFMPEEARSYSAFMDIWSPDGITRTIEMSGTGVFITPPAITAETLPNGAVGTAYEQTLSATGDAPFRWTVESGSLPNGLTLSANGVISGTPTVTGSYDFTVMATNDGGSDTKAFTIVIVKGPGATVSAPTLASKTANSITINAVTAPTNGQTVEYACERGSTPPADGWQPGIEFTGLIANTTYYIFARAAENANYLLGAASLPLSVTTDQPTGVSETEQPNPLKAYVRSGMLHVTGLTAGETLSVYNAAGVLVYQNIASADETDIPLTVQGVYMVRQGDFTIKVSF